MKRAAIIATIAAVCGIWAVNRNNSAPVAAEPEPAHVIAATPLAPARAADGNLTDAESETSNSTNDDSGRDDGRFVANDAIDSGATESKVMDKTATDAVAKDAAAKKAMAKDAMAKDENANSGASPLVTDAVAETDPDSESAGTAERQTADLMSTAKGGTGNTEPPSVVKRAAAELAAKPLEDFEFSMDLEQLHLRDARIRVFGLQDLTDGGEEVALASAEEEHSPTKEKPSPKKNRSDEGESDESGSAIRYRPAIDYSDEHNRE